MREWTTGARGVVACAALWGAVGCTVSAGDRVQVPEGDTPIHHAVVVDEDLASAVDAEIVDALYEADLPGLGVAIVRDGEVVFCGGYGWADIATERPMQGDTPVLLSSVSKTFIGTTAMQAVAAGMLDLDQPVRDVVGFEVNNPKVDGDAVTVRDLLTHNSGIRDTSEYSSAYADGDPTIELEDFVRGYITKGGDYYRRGNWAREMPGTQFAYSNVGASLGALAVGKAYGVEYAEVVRRDVLEPLGMEDSAFFLSEVPKEPATPYRSRLGKGAFRELSQYGYPTYPDGMMRSPACDVGRYVAAIAGGGVLEGVRIMEEEDVDEMLTVDVGAGTDEDGQAVAWAMREMGGHELYGHNGG
ncbi:MAG: serine hydrolase domain-containing protein, partial [Myxococcota bacterium]